MHSLQTPEEREHIDHEYSNDPNRKPVQPLDIAASSSNIDEEVHFAASSTHVNELFCRDDRIRQAVRRSKNIGKSQTHQSLVRIGKF